jgi:hypothetical protein
MSTTRTQFTFRVDTWTPDGESIVEHVAGIEDYQVALVTYRAACQRWPGIPITLRQGARVIEDSRRLRVVQESSALVQSLAPPAAARLPRASTQPSRLRAGQ